MEHHVVLLIVSGVCFFSLQNELAPCVCTPTVYVCMYTLGALLVCTFNYKSNFHQTRSKRFIFLKGVDQPRQISVEQFICFVEIEAKDA